MRYFDAKFISACGFVKQFPSAGKTEIVFVGRSNVGKSSLLNKLFNRKKLARVSAVPGKTATINFYSVDDVYFVDLPGYGYAKVSKAEKERWSSLIEGYFQDDRLVGLVVLLVDIRHDVSCLDLRMIEFLIECELPFIVVLTKMDKLGKMKRCQMLERIKKDLVYFDQICIIECSSKTGEGIEEIRRYIEDVCRN